ncbi:MAG: hypothetical protein ACRD1K_03945 [Acidimicrobiales bacterium]
MTVSFRNIDFDEAARIEAWPAEAIEILIDRGSLSDWRRLASALAADPWGPLSQTVEQAIGPDSHYGVDRIMERILQQQRSRPPTTGRRR